MALQTNLSKKDKITIAILLFAAAVFMFIWFLIRPTISSIFTLNDKIEQAKITQDHNKEKIIYLSSGGAIYEKAVNDLNDSTKDYYEKMDSSEIDKMVTSYILKSGLFAEDLIIRMPVDSVDESPYSYSSLSKEKTTSSDSSQETAATDTDSADNLLNPYNNSRNNSTSTKFSGVQCVGITLVVTGSRSTCQAFIDDISKKQAVRITSFKWDKVDPIEFYNQETKQIELQDPGIERLQISMNLYMAEFEDYGAVTADSAT